jgi:hypothetical protein
MVAGKGEADAPAGASKDGSLGIGSLRATRGAGQ